MKTGIERIRQQKADNEKKAAAAADKLAGLKKTHTDMEAKIDAAIAAGDQVTVEKLMRNKNDVSVQLEIAEKTLALLQKPIDRAAVAAAWADDLADFQKQIDKGEKELNQLIRQAVEKALAIADTINASWEARQDALLLVGDGEAFTFNAGNQDFETVHFTGDTLINVAQLLSREEHDTIRKDAGAIIGLATRDRTNIYYHRG